MQESHPLTVDGSSAFFAEVTTVALNHIKCKPFIWYTLHVQNERRYIPVDIYYTLAFGRYTWCGIRKLKMRMLSNGQLQYRCKLVKQIS